MIEIVKLVAMNLIVSSYVIAIMLLTIDLNLSVLNVSGFVFRAPLNIISKIA